ncbi:competence protein ComK [Bacillus sp. 165]|uniref:competence protein ComK n=1 Tax=Bacillus sp. 165 TaxID=1529117 RepID=UPI001ADCA4C7|nr:competence protein ComK [Bacillus sp. 165]MBO9128708.1 competence protein ComK [Bacillus sp. 165]
MKKTLEKYLPEYIVSGATMAVLPVTTKDKRVITLILEEEDLFLVLKKPVEVIEQSCKYYGSSYIGRKEGTKELIGVTHKAPTAISPTDNLYFFPTTSSVRKECAWLSHFHVASNKQILHGTLLVTLTNGQTLKLDMSKGSFDNQLYRTAQLRSAFEDRKKHKSFVTFRFAESNQIFEPHQDYERQYLTFLDEGKEE